MDYQNSEDAVNSELESRLDELFGEEDSPLDDLASKSQPEDDSLSELKNLVLSLDWEITEEVLVNILKQIEDLKIKYQDDRTILIFLRILGYLGEYIKTDPAKAHPKTFKILNSVFSRMAEVVQSPGLTESEKKRILRAEIEKYNALRKQITPAKPDTNRKKRLKTAQVMKLPMRGTKKPAPAPIKPAEGRPPAVPAKAVMDRDYFHDALTRAIEEIKQYIDARFEALRTEMKFVRPEK
ncbi:MAG: hypothetical protein JSW39_03245 [Desulfobacterales bacterium]|nr:MAG: hypothetical protein JSW39_03245 [Desulfobacterales bacterium]